MVNQTQPQLGFLPSLSAPVMGSRPPSGCGKRDSDTKPSVIPHTKDKRKYLPQVFSFRTSPSGLPSELKGYFYIESIQIQLKKYFNMLFKKK